MQMSYCLALTKLHISTELKECIKKGQTSRPRRAAEIAQLGERQTEDLKVPGSTPKLEKSNESSLVSALFCQSENACLLTGSI